MKVIKTTFPIMFMVSSLILFSNFCFGRVIYVDDDAVGLNDGSSWENAYNYLQDALADANSSEKPIEIRVAEGIYRPDEGSGVESGDYTLSFQLIDGVTLSGGYLGHVTGALQSDPNLRDIELYETILSGDLLYNDANDIDPNNYVNDPTCYDNSYHVVTYSASFGVQHSEQQNLEHSTQNEKAILDGFTITAGNAGGYYLDLDSKSKGGGIYIESGSPIISNCTFMLNAAYEGGAIYNDNSEPNIVNCRFVKNSANYYYYILSPLGGTGGAIKNNKSSPIITNCEFKENFACSGGGLYNYIDSNSIVANCMFTGNKAGLDEGGGLFNFMSNPILTDCNFCENYAASSGGAISNNNFSNLKLDNCKFTANQSVNNGGAINNTEYSQPNITNCIFTENSAGSGGAIENEYSDPNLVNCTFRDNHAYSGGSFDNNYGSPRLIDCVFSNNSAVSNASVMQNFFGEPVFINCILSGNTSSGSVGAVLNAAGNMEFVNCTLFGNFAGLAGNAVQNSSLILPPDFDIPGSISFLNCIIWNGENAILNQKNSFVTINYCDVQNSLAAIDDLDNGLIWGQGNIDAYPDFVEPGRWVDVNDPNITVEPNDANATWLEGDYHLKSTAGHYDPNSKTWINDDVNSPCIDAGDPNSLIKDEPLPNGNRINMGAYGGTNQASMTLGEPLVAYWPLDETEGDIAADLAGVNDANVNDPHWIEGKLNGALLFDGSNTYMDCGDSKIFSTAQMTISLWLEPDENQTSYILSRRSADLETIDYGLILHEDGRIELEIGQKNLEPVYLLSSAEVIPAQWTNVTITLNGSSTSIYINGQLDNSIDFAQRTTSDNFNLIIGAFAGLTDFFQGKLDEIRIYNRALNQQEIQFLAQ